LEGRLIWLDLTGGEITLREDLLEVIKIILKHSDDLSVLHISTNGQLPDKILSLTDVILKHKVTPIINIGLDGPRKINDLIRGCDGAYLKSLQTFKLLKKFSRGHYYLSCTISDYNADYLDEFLRELNNDIEGFSFSDLHFNIFHRSAHYYMNQEIDGLSSVRFNSIEKYLKLSKKGNFIKYWLEDLFIRGLRKYLTGESFFINCQSFKNTCFINPYGEVYPCGMYGRSAGNLVSSGYDFKKIWQQTGTEKIRDEIRNKRCPGCWSPCESYPALLGDLRGACSLLLNG
jgi:MoaA/NifB/PqqE/SkfB family radical SAM enzyme